MGKLMKFSIISAAVLLMTGCTLSGAGKAADQYYTALEEGDAEAAAAYFSESAEDELENFRKITGGIQQMCENYDPGEETEEELRSLLKTVVSHSYIRHEIKSVEKVSDTEYTVTADVEMITDESSAACLEALDYDSFYDEDAEELKEILQNEGEEAAGRFAVTKMIHCLNLSSDTAFENAVYEKRTCRLLVILEGDVWKIRDIERE